MRVLVLGAAGMLGSALVTRLRVLGTEVIASTLADCDVTKRWDIERVFARERPNAAVNCVGIKTECSEDQMFAANAHAPHVIARAAREYGARLVHISTDGVFSGRRGTYCESDLTDAENPYGQSKAIGEIANRLDCLTIRTSFIGRDLTRKRGLLEWLLRSTGDVSGYMCQLWSGLSTLELARVIGDLLLLFPALSGLYHVAGPPITKADLLETLVRELKLNCRVARIPSEPIDRTLDATRFQEATGYMPPDWVTMAKELAQYA